MYQYILLDADDTLLDFKKSQQCAFEAVLAHYAVPFTQELYETYDAINHKLWGRLEQGEITKQDIQNQRFALFFQAVGKSIPGQEAEALYQQYLGKQAWLLPFAQEVCRQLAQRCTLVIATNGISSIQKERLAACTLLPYITHTVISDEVGFAKPDKRFFEYTLGLLGNPKRQEVLMVGDSLTSDIKGANNTGIDACWYNPARLPLPQGYAVEHSISDLRQLLPIVGI